MKKSRITALPLVVVVAVVALVVGTFGAAQASGLSNRQVKKLVTKVINKKASSLSVAHADNATNAANLNGQPASAYQNPSTTYVLPVQAAASTRTYTLNGVGPGTYLVSYSVFMQTGVSAKSDCRIFNSATSSAAEAWLYGTNYSTYNSQTGSAVITVGATPPRLYCEASTAWSIYSGGDIVSRVTATRLDSLTTVATTGAKAEGTESKSEGSLIK